MATRVASIVADIGINTGKFDKGVQSVLKSLGFMKGDFAKFGVAVGAAGVVIGAVAAQMKKAMDVTVTYADEVRTLSSVTMQSAEETSKMIQVLDDYKLTSQQAGAAARFLAKEGLSLNIETLAKLSDEYKGLNSGQEKATFLMKNFGKAGQDFALVMDQGSEAILKQGDSVKKGLILSEKQLKAARDLEIAQDNLNDTQQALTVTVGNKVIPVWSRYLDSLNRAIDTGNFFKENIDNVVWALDQLKGRGEMNVTTLEEMALAQTNAYKAIKLTDGATSDLADSLAGLYDDVLSASGPVKDMYNDLGLAALRAGQEMRGVTGKEAAQEVLDYERAMGMITEEVYNAKTEALGLMGALDGLNGREIFIKINMEKYGFSSVSEMFSQDKPKGKTGKSGRVGGAIGDALGGPVRAGGWTMVGEQGFELIDPSGNVHSNQNSKRLLKQGVVPSRYAMEGTDDGGGSYYLSADARTAMNAAVTGQESPFSVLWSGANNSSGGGGGGGGGAVLQVAQQSVQASQQSAQASNAMVSVSQQSAQMQVASNSALIEEVRQLRKEFPRAVRDAVQQVVAQ